MLKLSFVELYLTNVCNLGCNNCNRFNNFAFKGHQRWQDNAEAYEKWSQIVDIETINLMGGEPITNPDIAVYIKEVRRLWPKSEITLVTNGTHMDKVKNISNDLRKYSVNLKISFHDRILASKTLADLDSILERPISITYKFREHNIRSWQKTYDNIRGIDWPDCDTPYDFPSLPIHIQEECTMDFDFNYEKFLEFEASRIIVDSLGLQIETNWYDHFHESAVKFDKESNKITLHDSDPVKAVGICDQKFCHNFNNGKLYKCGPVALLPDFVNQFKIEISREDLEIINSYQAASPDWPIDKINDFLTELSQGNPIPQCKFCPESFNSKRLTDVQTKPKISKR